MVTLPRLLTTHFHIVPAVHANQHSWSHIGMWLCFHSTQGWAQWSEFHHLHTSAAGWMMAFSLDKTGGPLCIWPEMTSETRWCWSRLIFFFIFGIMLNSRILKMSSTEPQTSHGCLSYIDWKECDVSLTHLCFLNELCAAELSQPHMWFCRCRRTDGSQRSRAVQIVGVQIM